MEKEDVIIVVLKVILVEISRRINHNIYLYKTILEFPEELRKFIPYRGYIGVFSVDESDVGRMYRLSGNHLIGINYKRIFKINKKLREKLIEVSNFIKKSEYDKNSGLYEFINEKTENSLIAFKLVKLNSKE